MAYKITGLYVYPIKSLKGISMEKVSLTENGFAYDRFWMIVEENGRFITQREIPNMALFQTAFTPTGLKVNYQDSSIEIPFDYPSQLETISVQIWNDQVLAVKESATVNDWFSEQLGRPVYVVRQAKNTYRPVKGHEDASVLFPDGSQYLVLGETALDLLNKKLEKPIPIDRFRANIIFENGTPHIEDDWASFQIKETTFEATKLCSRCPVICIDQATAERSKEPTRTLASYRVINKKIYFGAFFKCRVDKNMIIQIGDSIIVE